MNNLLFEHYQKRLFEIPEPGSGMCHVTLLGVANLGIKAGLEPQQVFAEMRQCIPVGQRRVPDKEIQDAIKKALHDAGKQFGNYQKSDPIVRSGETTLRRIIEQGRISDEADLWEASPIRLLDEPQKDAVLFLKTVFRPDDRIYIGLEFGKFAEQPNYIKTTAEHIQNFQNGGKTFQHIIVNPFTGTIGKTKDGKDSYRADDCIKTFRHALIEFDNISREDQIRFWSAVDLPIKALIDSGGKSIHAWVDVQRLAEVQTMQQWESEIKVRLYERILKPLGLDAACSNPGRLSRLPGHFRSEKGRYQRLLWLSPEGKKINDD